MLKERITKNEPFINKYSWERINYLTEKVRKHLRNITQKLSLVFCMLKKENYIFPMFWNKIQIVKNKLFFQWFKAEKNYAKLSPKDV